MSSGVPVRRRGAIFTKSASHSGGSPGMVIVPGAMAFTRTSGASDFASTRVSITTPAFAIECAKYPGHPSSPPVSAKLMITPFVLLSHGAAACAQKNGAFKFASSAASHTSSVVEITLDGKKFAALLIKISSRPNSCAASRTIRRISSTEVSSAPIATARPPTPTISPTTSPAPHPQRPPPNPQNPPQHFPPPPPPIGDGAQPLQRPQPQAAKQQPAPAASL